MSSFTPEVSRLLVTLTTHSGIRGRRKVEYGVIRDAKSGELLISATLEYCLRAIKNRGWKVVGQ